jgi:predicted tellurium resistance membrane protein TerC
VDNLFVWITLFNFFAVPAEFQKRVLLYGVLGAIVMRAVLIYVGALLLGSVSLDSVCLWPVPPYSQASICWCSPNTSPI